MPASRKVTKSTALVPVAAATHDRIVAAPWSASAAVHIAGTDAMIERD